jgi:hypothetical protein
MVCSRLGAAVATPNRGCVSGVEDAPVLELVDQGLSLAAGERGSGGCGLAAPVVDHVLMWARQSRWNRATGGRLVSPTAHWVLGTG